MAFEEVLLPMVLKRRSFEKPRDQFHIEIRSFHFKMIAFESFHEARRCKRKHLHVNGQYGTTQKSSLNGQMTELLIYFFWLIYFFGLKLSFWVGILYWLIR